MTNMNNNNKATGSDIDNLIRQREFGDRFRVAREAAGMSISEVADELRLAEDIIKALENSQIDSLPAPTFTQGYIRSYAKILKLPVDEIIKVYDQLIPEKDSPLSVSTALAAQKNSSDMGIKLITLGLLMVALVMLVFWFQQTDFDFINADKVKQYVTEFGAKKEQVELSELSDKPELSQQTPEVEINSETESANTNRDFFVEQNTIEEDVINTENPAAVLSVEKSLVEEGSAMDTTGDAQTEEEARAGDVQLQEAAKKKVLITQPTVGNDILVMATDDESWAEVEDANGARLYFDLMKKDNEYKLRGQAPFMLFLGNAPSVTLGVNNKLLNVSDYVRRNNIAHIQISEDGTIYPVRRRVAVPGSADDLNSNQNPDTVETTNNLQPASEDE